MGGVVLWGGGFAHSNNAEPYSVLALLSVWQKGHTVLLFAAFKGFTAAVEEMINAVSCVDWNPPTVTINTHV